MPTVGNSRSIITFAVKSDEGDVFLADCSDLLTDFLRSLGHIQSEYLRAMAGL
ncbi:hypothetical protein U5640_21735 [Streptomyces sp. SS7]|uniref:hypothetical protein n=1 Tax=Streptomyces sp. SS7 TaxID=3108485 RepID=UPI0030EC53F7